LDEKRLYVADSQEKKIYVWSVDADGKIYGKKLFIDMRSDTIIQVDDINAYPVVWIKAE
jgi:sugar lactone lactonase YvrE